MDALSFLLMKNRTLLLFLLLLIAARCKSQNLIPNSSFELHDTCPHGWAFMPTSWFSASTGSPDYFNECANSAWDVDIPINAVGHQYARTGAAYCGLITYTQPPGSPVEYREYIEAQLSMPLQAHHTYHFEMYLSCADSCQFFANSIGVYFSDTMITAHNFNPFPVLPQLSVAAGLMTDTVHWFPFGGDYTAAGGEDFVTIGNFNNDANTVHLQINTTWLQYAYYYIDDVSLWEGKVQGIEDPGESISLRVYPNPFADELTIEADDGEYELILYDLIGKKLLHRSFRRTTVMNTAALVPGIYFYELRNEKGLVRKGKVIRD